MEIKKTAEQVLEESYLDYSAFVLQRRVLPDSRDGMKHTQRQILHAAYKEGLRYNKPYKKSQKMTSAATSFSYVHGDTSAYGQVIRMGRPLVTKYKYIDIQGNYGTPISSKDYSAPRYTEARLSEMTDYLFKYLNEGVTGDEWLNTYDDEDQYPILLPSVGMYPLCNGIYGAIGTVISSVPQFNLREMNKVICDLIDDENAEVDLLPDFASGGVLLNPKTTAKSLAKGEGKSVLLRGEIKRDKKYLSIKSLPYGVYTTTICNQLGKALDGKTAPFKDFKDLSKRTVDIRVYGDDLDKIEKWLIKNTSYQKHFTIKMTMLDKGKIPKIFNLKEAILSHLDHSKIMLRRHYEYSWNKLTARKEVVEGLLKAHSIIDKIVAKIKASNDRKNAIENLIAEFDFSDLQASAIVDLKLHRLTNLDITKLKNELGDLVEELNHLEDILNNINIFNEELKKRYIEVAEKFGEPRRTKIVDYSDWEEEDSQARTKPFYFKVDGLKYETSTLELEEGVLLNPDTTLQMFSSIGRLYSVPAEKLAESGNLTDLIKLKEKTEEIIEIIPLETIKENNHWIFNDKYSLHNSFLTSISVRGKYILSKKINYLITSVEGSKTSPRLPSLPAKE